jgi:hypothetical protein
MNRFVFDPYLWATAVKNSIGNIIYRPFGFSWKLSIFYLYLSIGLSITLLLFVFFVFLSRNIGFFNYFVLVSPFFASLIMTFTSLEMHGGERYGFPVAVMYVLSLYYLLRLTNVNNKIKIIIHLYIFSSIIFGLQNYSFKPGFSTHPEWHNWSDEVEKFQNGEQDFISLYPQWESAYWLVELPRK